MLGFSVVICLKISIFALAETIRFSYLSNKQGITKTSRNKKMQRKMGIPFNMMEFPLFVT